MTEAVDTLFTERAATMVARPGTELPPDLGADEALQLLDSMMTSRHLDLAARWLRTQDRGYYTIGSSGHESNAAVAAALRPTDPALLHYRSGGFFQQRASQVPGHDGIRDVLLGVVAATSEPMSGGRHKVFGHPDLHVIPQTSTIASHLPRALGVAFSLSRARRLGVELPWPRDAVVVCSLGDASANHSTAVGAINAALQASYRGMPVPLLLVCEDNGIGISVRTPQGWTEHTWSGRPGLEWFDVDGADLVETVRTARAAAHFVRTHRRPAMLRLRTVRLMGHAGSDVESAYRSPADIAQEMERDPLLAAADLLVGAGVLSAGQVVERYEQVRDTVLQVASEVAELPQHTSPDRITEPIAFPDRTDVAAAVLEGSERAGSARADVHGRVLPEDEGPLTLAQSVNRALLDGAARHPGLLVFGEDVGRKGGVYGVTRGLQKKLGETRVFDTLLDEQTILGLALGAGVSGMLPVPEIQYLAYLHNAEDQLRGEAATLPFFSDGQYHNPMVVRIAGLGYQKGFGGHFHNDNAIGVLRDIPGLVIAVPSRPDDAASMLLTCLAAAESSGTTSAYLEPIALYHTKDLHEPGDGLWATAYPDPAADPGLGRARTHGDGTDLTIVTFANGVPMSLRVARRLAADGIHARVLDLRWLAPLPLEDLLEQAEITGRVLVVDETRRTGGVSEGIVTALVDAGFGGRVRRVASHDSFIPLGDAALAVLLTEETIEEAARELAGAGRTPSAATPSRPEGDHR